MVVLIIVSMLSYLNPDLARLTLFKFLSMSEYLVAVRQENWPSMQEIKNLTQKFFGGDVNGAIFANSVK